MGPGVLGGSQGPTCSFPLRPQAGSLSPRVLSPSIRPFVIALTSCGFFQD